MKILRVKRPTCFGMGALSVVVMLSSASGYAGDRKPTAQHPAYQQECSACHVAYPPKLLSVASWRTVMSGLDKHFGSDASLDAATQADILHFLEQNAGKRETSLNGKPQLRITETSWFVQEHSGELPRNIWKHPAVKSAANCAACHTAAEKGNFSERTLRLPKGINQ